MALSWLHLTEPGAGPGNRENTFWSSHCRRRVSRARVRSQMPSVWRASGGTSSMRWRTRQSNWMKMPRCVQWLYCTQLTVQNCFEFFYFSDVGRQLSQADGEDEKQEVVPAVGRAWERREACIIIHSNSRHKTLSSALQPSDVILRYNSPSESSPATVTRKRYLT